LYSAPTGTLVAAGDPAAGPALAQAAERSGWRVLIGDAAICDSLLEAYPRSFIRRRPAVREQRFMAAVPEAVGDEPVEGFRSARVADVDRLTEFACRLHVEDEMGPPVSRSSRPAVRSRMLETVSRGHAWVVERDGQVVAKIDLSLHSRRRGAQIAGVYVEAAWRGVGVGQGAVRTLTRRLFEDGLPAVTLHVRADNVAAIRAYRRASFVDRGAWRLALR
ncbi:MAG: GNAT family N-acetyltransferase, partial [Actinomycetota bacterium]|nr:GNAT family N-acetyltransferase [Actinomycetota bacterium]